jgi:hypothetical protein
MPALTVLRMRRTSRKSSGTTPSKSRTAKVMKAGRFVTQRQVSGRQLGPTCEANKGASKKNVAQMQTVMIGAQKRPWIRLKK